MDFESFAYWLRGFYEINGETALTEKQSKIISKHLTLCFTEEAKNLPTLSEKFILDALRREEMHLALGASHTSIDESNLAAHEKETESDIADPDKAYKNLKLEPGAAMESEDFKEDNAAAAASNSSKIDNLVNDYHKAMEGLNKKVNTSSCSGFHDFRPTVSCMLHRRLC